MNTKEFPPKEEQYTEIPEEQIMETPDEHSESIPVTQEQDTRETDVADIETTKQEVLKAIKKSEDFVPEQHDMLRTIKKSEDFVAPPQKKDGWWKNFKRVAALSLGLAVASGASASTGNTSDGKTGKTTTGNTTKTASVPAPKKATGISFYAGGVEKTPTGKDNAFHSNEAALSQEALLAFAEQYGLSTESNEAFQQSLMTKYPEVVNKIIVNSKDGYGMPKAGRFDDGILGARVREVMEEIKKLPPAISETTKEEIAPTTPKPAEESLKGYRGTSIYDGRGHLAGLQNYRVYGNERFVEFVFVDKYGNPDEVRGKYLIPSSIWGNKYSKGVNRIFTEEGIDQYRVGNNTDTQENLDKSNN